MESDGRIGYELSCLAENVAHYVVSGARSPVWVFDGNPAVENVTLTGEST